MINDSYKNILQKMPYGYAYHKIILDDKGKPINYEFIEVNQHFENITGLKTKDIINRKVTEAIPGITEEGDFNWIEFYGKIALYGTKEEFEQYSLPLKRWYKVFVNSPQKYYFTTIFTDVTDRKKAKEILKNYENIFMHTNDMICIIGCDGYFKKINPTWQKKTGWKKEELLSKKWTDFIHKDDRQITEHTFHDACKGEKVLHFQNRFICKDGSVKWFLWDLIPYESENTIMGIVRDNSKNIILEKEKEAFNKLLIERVKELTFLNNFSKYIFISQPQVSKILKQIISLMPHAFQNPKKTYIKIQTGNTVLQTDNFKKTGNYIFESFVTSTYGKIKLIIYVDLPDNETTNSFYNEEKSLLKTVAEILNIYIQKTEAIEKERLSEQKFAELFNSVNDIIFTANPYGKILTVNNEFEKQTGYKFSKNFNFFNIINNPSANKLKQKMLNLYKMKKKQSFFDVEIFNSDDEVRTYEIRVKINYNNNSVEEIFGIARDVTELRATHNLLMRTIIDTEEKERKHFAEELHDGIGPLLSGINMYMEKIQSNQNLPFEDSKLIKYCNELVNDTIKQIRVISNDLMPRLINKYGLTSSLNSFISKINHLDVINITLSGNNFEARDISGDMGITIYRSMTELINNSLKHSNAKNINIKIIKNINSLSITYSDDGQGFNFKSITSAHYRSGLGLNNIISRIKSFNGTVDFLNEPDDGVLISIEIPLSQNKP